MLLMVLSPPGGSKWIQTHTYQKFLSEVSVTQKKYILTIYFLSELAAVDQNLVNSPILENSFFTTYYLKLLNLTSYI
jgi:hypothetical protein